MNKRIVITAILAILITIVVGIVTIYILQLTLPREDSSITQDNSEQVKLEETKKKADELKVKATEAVKKGNRDEALRLFKESRSLYEDYEKARALKNGADVLVNENVPDIDAEIFYLENTVTPTPTPKPKESDLPRS